MQAFYIKFPEFKPNNFWIAGESYCGMYIPFMANQILTQDPSIKLQDILIGNGAMWLNWNWRRMIGDKFWMSYYYYGPQIGALIAECKYTDGNYKIHPVSEEWPLPIRYNLYFIRAVDTANPDMTIGTPDASEVLLGQYKTQRFDRARFNIPDNQKMFRNFQGRSDSPCTDDVEITNYFNRDTVRAQLQIKRADPWTPCSQKVGNNYKMSNQSLSFFPTFKQKGLKVPLYSGNVDAVVPYVETEEFIKQIGWQQTSQKKLVNARGSLMGWKIEYIQYFDLYQKITIRKLEYLKKADVQRELLSFVKKNLGKNYEINFKKLVTMESDVNWDMINKEKEQERGYFCSELVAKAFKNVGLLDEKKSSCRYWPVDFAQKNGLMLKKGAFLGKQQVIVLNKHLKNYVGLICMDCRSRNQSDGSEPNQTNLIMATDIF